MTPEQVTSGRSTSSLRLLARLPGQDGWYGSASGPGRQGLKASEQLRWWADISPSSKLAIPIRSMQLRLRVRSSLLIRGKCSALRATDRSARHLRLLRELQPELDQADRDCLGFLSMAEHTASPQTAWAGRGSAALCAGVRGLGSEVGALGVACVSRLLKFPTSRQFKIPAATGGGRYGGGIGRAT